jgi:hypothetical protein
MRSPETLGFLLIAISCLTATAARPELEHLDGFDDYFVSRDFPGLAAGRWSATAILPSRAVLDLRRVADGRTAADFVARFNRRELDDVVLLLPPVRAAGWGAADLNADGGLDMLIDQEDCSETWRWAAEEQDWVVSGLPAPLGSIGARFGVVGEGSEATMVIRSVAQLGAWSFREGRWRPEPAMTPVLELDGERLLTSAGGADRGIRLLDLDGDGRDELLVAGEDQLTTFAWRGLAEGWVAGGPAVPHPLVTAAGGDNGLRFLDPDGDGRLVAVLSNERGHGVSRLDRQRRRFVPLIPWSDRDPAAGAAILPIAVEGEPTGGWWDPARRDIRRRTDTAGPLSAGTPDSIDRPLAFALAFEDTVPGFGRILRNDGGNEVYWNYLGETSPNHFIRQQQVGTTLAWETAAIPEGIDSDTVTLLFAGATGYVSEPPTEGFELVAGTAPPVRFDLAREDQEWTSDDGGVTLRFRCTFRSAEDAAGLYELSLPRSAVEQAGLVPVSVSSLGSGSNRWFAIHPMRYPLPPPAGQRR